MAERRNGDVAILAPRGRIDHESSQAFQQRVLAALTPQAKVLCDFSGVDYVSTAGLRALMAAAKHATAKGARVGLGGLQPEVRKIFAIARFSYVLPIFDTVDEAVAAWKS
ncbi:STAS domain-containing protein [Zavarzinia sp. CC-PAN008]|uniref:STAS domain-containing protein n=1 Tax=Zavarzinia sp. CC-PAN008 TaxID=3243332 RepID=UPI003F74690D